MPLDDRPSDDIEYPIQSSEIAIAWTLSEDMLEEIIQIGREVCDEPVSMRF